MFQYYLSGIADHTHVTAALLRDRGLDGVLRDYVRNQSGMAKLRTSCNVVQRGPDKSKGVLVSPLPADDSLPASFGFHPDRQTWLEIRNPKSEIRNDGYWMGYDPEHVPTPPQLRRMTPLIDGYDIVLGDEHVWTCPRIRRPHGELVGEGTDGERLELRDGTTWLPRSLGVDHNGTYCERVLPEYEDAWKMAGEMFEVFLGLRDIEPIESLQYAVRSLALNYRLGLQEATALRILNTNNVARVFKATFDGELLEEFARKDDEELAAALDAEDSAEKKTADAACFTPATDSTPGAGGSPDTVPHTANSTSTPREPARTTR